ncbi:MAG TPA: GlsB/YeaQ/YmgE family stress response membrane protein [Thermoanaerobaculia bacterium]|nr:GlsB/YeaQ/YmgE family stress response membrane protein [Thermoanaerobaculia bacterium]
MSYLIVVVTGTVAGWITGKYLKGSEAGVVPDLIAGAAGACLAVLFSRVFGPEAAMGFFVSFVVAVLGAVASLFALRYVTKEEPVKVTRRRPRY